MVRMATRIVLLVVLGSASLSGCGHVRPWEREDLARITRQLDRNPSAYSYEVHMWMVREGALGGSGKPGGGCGCN